MSIGREKYMRINRRDVQDMIDLYETNYLYNYKKKTTRLSLFDRLSTYGL